MRQFLITKFVCSKCGENLELTYDVPKNAGSHASGEPTGADKVEQLIAIEPCRCVTREIEEMRRAAKVLLGSKP
jgi:hypothetical protein